ncbi:MAG TPA: hypothetical protein VJO33_04740 [Gemmatimonadaceae bacterium]|nr:hypothetical protein [Gemmatimonadaceae bacterium]
MNDFGDVLRWLEQAPPDTLIPVRTVLALMRAASPQAPANAPRESAATTWRERLWTAPPDTRLGISELSEAIGRPKSWIYKRTSQKSAFAPIPHRHLDGGLVFVAGELRQWLAQQEQAIVAPRSIVVPITRRSSGKEQHRPKVPPTTSLDNVASRD